MVAAIPAKFRGRTRRDAAAFYLSQLAKGILSGELAIQSGEQATVVATSEFVLLEFQVKQKKRVNQVEMRLRWPKRVLIRIARGEGVENGRE